MGGEDLVQEVGYEGLECEGVAEDGEDVEKCDSLVKVSWAGLGWMVMQSPSLGSRDGLPKGTSNMLRPTCLS